MPSFNQYQQTILKYLSPESKADQLINGVLGLTGEAGEVADLVKKVKHHGHTFDHKKLQLELGDCLFYIAEIADEINTTLDDIALLNLEKLQKRYPTGGFNREDSITKKDQA